MTTSTRDRILDSAQQLVLERGFAAMTVDAVLEGAFLLVRALGDRSAMRRQFAHLRHYTATRV